ncbi:GGDEF domain-containing protein [Croceicoccus bisphenolivorans]|uniref:GGDEF domain-containing protein n=1 Tax=Croceicoccus bisphenolivorans TaxID=1783232 RepID=UPI00155FC01B|nr:GGDEF domain-containing protein [Croceicoccus bisphenolivorans]
MKSAAIHWATKAFGAVLLCMAALLPITAHAEDVRPGCWAATSTVSGGDDPVLPRTDRWICDGQAQEIARGTSWLFFTPADFAMLDTPPDHFVTDIGRFERIHLIVMDASGPLRSRAYSMRDVGTFVNGPKFALPLPDMTRATGLVVAIEKPWSPAIMSQAQLQTRHDIDDALGWSNSAMLVLALLVGLLATPLAYNAAFYRILREPFVLWMLAAEISMLAYVLVSSGLFHHIVDVSLPVSVSISALTLFAPMLFSTGFFLSYLEERTLSETMHQLLMSTAIATGIVGAFFCLPMEFLRPYGHDLFLGAPVPLLVAVAAACVMAARNGSNAVWFQAASWTALAVSALAVMARSSGMGIAGAWPDILLYAAIFAHVAIGSIAVVYRVDIMRRERERVNARLESLTNLIDLDPLTGIFNRRALEQRFAELRSDGFHALAVVDLDHFKQVNDRFGHTVGDRVLQEVAAVLASDKDAIAFRMGGEEFVIMLRGAQIQQRAEQLRRAITIRIANEVDGIDGPITASMGLIESPPGGISSMRQLYSQADRLLYEAKYSGRNRLITERIQVFTPPSRERRMKDRRRESA